MIKFEPNYMTYWTRLFNSSDKLLLATLAFTCFLFFNVLSEYRTAAILVFGGYFIGNFYLLAKRNEKYLKSIIITESQVELIITELDKEIIVIRNDLTDTRIKIVELFFGFTSWGRNFRLEIDFRKNEKFQTVLVQYEIGVWNLDLFKRIYSTYSEMKKVPNSSGSLKRANF